MVVTYTPSPSALQETDAPSELSTEVERAIVENDLKLAIDGKRKHVSLRSVFW